MPQYRLATNDQNKATELPLCRVGGSVEKNPHMRAFWFAAICFFLASFVWFALAPLGLEAAKSMWICENQLHPPAINPKRKAYLKFKDLKSETFYCRYGRDDADNPTDCNAGPLGSEPRYDVSVLPDCVCTAGTHCKTTLGDAGTASVTSTIFASVALGTLLERFGPVNVQTSLMLFCAFWVALAATINEEWNYLLVRFFIGVAGSTFVTNQFWCSLMFAPNIVGTASAAAAGWGSLGGGVTQFFMIVVLFDPFVSAGMSENTAWRVAMLVPAGVLVICGLFMKLLAWDTPTRRRFNPVADTGTGAGASLMDYVECLKDFRVVVMIFQCSACFGTELVMNNQLTTHFRTYFQMNPADASVLAACFGCMNFSLGGITIDRLFKTRGVRGRIWAQFLALFFEAVFLFCVGLVDNSQEWHVTLIVLLCFSLFVHMAEGTSVGIVPFMSMSKTRSACVCVSALVGAGGGLGAVIAGVCIYRRIDDDLLPFRVHAGYVMFCALLSPLLYWPEHGGMFSGPESGANEAKEETPAASESAVTGAHGCAEQDVMVATSTSREETPAASESAVMGADGCAEQEVMAATATSTSTPSVVLGMRLSF